MIGNVRVKEVRTETFLRLLQLSEACIGRGMRPALVVPYLREILVKGETTRAERRLLARTDKQLYTWFRECFLTAKVRAGIQELGEKLEVTRRNRMVTTLKVASQLVEQRMMLGQAGLPEAGGGRGVSRGTAARQDVRDQEETQQGLGAADPDGPDGDARQEAADVLPVPDTQVVGYNGQGL